MIEDLLKSTDAYRQAVNAVKSSPAAMAALGAPVKEGLYVSGNVNVTNSSGAAQLSFPVSGSKDKGTVYLYSLKSDGEWHFRELMLEVKSSQQRIDLLAGQKGE